jgi:hypothetical protein
MSDDNDNRSGNGNGNDTRRRDDPAMSEVLKDAFYVAAAAAATFGVMELILGAANSTSASFRAAVRHNDHNATASLAQLAASVTKILGDEHKTCQKVVIRESRADGAPVVT